MIPHDLYGLVKELWPLLSRAGHRQAYAEPRLLLAIAFVQSGLEEKKLFHLDEESMAQRLDLRSWNMSNVATAVAMAACRLANGARCFGLPRLAVAAFLSSCEVVREAGGQVPRDPSLQRQVRDVIAVWHWIVKNLDDMLLGVVPASVPTTVSAGTGRGAQLQPDVTRTSSGGASLVLAPPPWRVHPDVVVSEDTVAVLEQLAGRLGLVYARNDAERTVYVGMPAAVVHPSRGRLVVPVPGADAASNGVYFGAKALDVITPCGSPVVACAAGTVLRTEGNTLLLALDTPFLCQGRRWPYAFYSHLSRHRHHVGSGEIGPHVVQGEVLGWSGLSRRLPCASLALWDDVHGHPHLPPQVLAGYFGWVGW